MYKYKANMVKVIDGDTIEANIDLGFGVSIRQKIRLFGIDTPELRAKSGPNRKAAKAAKRRLQGLLGASKGKFKLISHGFGKFGRCLGEIFVEDENINELLIKEGHAVRYEE